jgi:hypothetical protein
MTGSGSNEQTASSVGADPRWARWLTYFPFVAGGGLAGLYALGALTRTTQLMGAHVTVRDTLPIVPLQQLLATGIGTVISSLVNVPIVLFTGLFLALSSATRRGTTEDADAEPRSTLSPEAIEKARVLTAAGRDREADRVIIRAVILDDWKSMLSSFVVGAASVFVAYPPATAATVMVLVGLVVLAIAFFPREMARRGGLGVLAVAGAAFAISVTVVNAYIYPQPLADIVLVRSGGLPDVRGKLVVDTGASWYVRDSPNHVRAVPASKVVDARVRSHGRPRDDRVADVVAGWFG